MNDTLRDTDLPPRPERSDSSSASSIDDSQEIHMPVPTRPGLSNRPSSGLVIPKDGSLSAQTDARSMSPRRTSEDLENMGRQAREELQQHAQALQNSLLQIFNRIEAVKEEHDKLDNNNKFLQKYIGDLMSTSKITATSSRGRK